MNMDAAQPEQPAQPDQREQSEQPEQSKALNDQEIKPDMQQDGPAVEEPSGPQAPSEPVFVSLFERKEPTTGKPVRSRNASGHTYTIRFFLVDSTGHHHLAATGIDAGDSHYEYTNEEGFPFLQCHNKTDVRNWADAIIRHSQASAGFYPDVVLDAVPPEGAAGVRLPQFVSYSETKETLPDGRHVIRWYLMDAAGHNHLAVTGEEKETRDGHYSYHTETIFNYAAPLESGNQEEVRRWLDYMIAAPFGSFSTPVGSRPRARPKSAGAGFPSSRPSRFSTGSRRGRGGRGTQRLTQKSRGRGPGRPRRGGSTLPGSSIPGGPFSHLFGGDGLTPGRGVSGGRGRGRGAWKIVDPDRDARDLVAAELRRWAQEEAESREWSKSQALAFVTDTGTGYGSPGGETEFNGKVISNQNNQDRATSSHVPPPPPPPHIPSSAKDIIERCLPLLTTNDETVVVSALREISHLPPTLSMISHPGLLDSVERLSKQSKPTSDSQSRHQSSLLARSLLEQWLRVTAAHARVLSDPKYLEDPVPRVEALVSMKNPKFDSIVTCITHRTLRDAAQHAFSSPQAPSPLPSSLPPLLGPVNSNASSPAFACLGRSGASAPLDNANASGSASAGTDSVDPNQNPKPKPNPNPAAKANPAAVNPTPTPTPTSLNANAAAAAAAASSLGKRGTYTVWMPGPSGLVQAPLPFGLPPFAMLPFAPALPLRMADGNSFPALTTTGTTAGLTMTPNAPIQPMSTTAPPEVAPEAVSVLEPVPAPPPLPASIAVTPAAAEPNEPRVVEPNDKKDGIEEAVVERTEGNT